MKGTTIRSRLNPKLEVSVIAGHFATRHSHNNHYIDITRMKHEHTMAREAGDGDVILMHDLSQSSVEAALRLVELLEEKGYCFVTVSELAVLRGTELEPGNVYTDFAEK